MVEQSTGVNALEGLIIPPDKTTINTKYTTLYLGATLFFLLLSILIWRWIKHARTTAAIANKKLDALERQLLTGAQTRQQAQSLITILSAGLGLRHLDQYQPEDMADWDAFKKRLNTASFAKASNEDIKALIKQARLYLKTHQHNPERTQ